MSAPLTSTIGTGGTYSTLAAWLADMPADITTGGSAGNYVANLKNQTWSQPGTYLTLSGITTDGTHTITIGCDTGASFRDNANKLTNALAPSASNGVCLITTGNYGTSSPLIIEVSNVKVFGLQCVGTGNQAGGIVVSNSTTNVVIDSCLIQASPTNSSAVTLSLQCSSGGVARLSTILCGPGGLGISLNASSTIDRCTVAKLTNSSSSGTAIQCQYSNNVLIGNAIFGCSTAITGTPSSSSDYNATDLSSLGTSYPATSHNLVSQAYSSCFVSTGTTPTAADFRLVSGSPLKDTGVAISGITADIIGTSIPQGTSPDIGAWELSAAATSFTAPASPTSIATGSTTTATITPNSNYTGTITGTPTGSASTGLGAVVKTFSGTATPQTASWTPSVVGTLTITWTNSGGLTNAGVDTITVTSAPVVPGTVSFDSSGTGSGTAFIKMTSTAATGGSGTKTYQWQFNVSGGSYSNISGATSASSVTHTGVSVSVNYGYQLVVTDTVSGSATSNAVTSIYVYPGGAIGGSSSIFQPSIFLGGAR